MQNVGKNLARLAILGAILAPAGVGAAHAQRAASPVTITVAYQKFPPPPYADDELWQKVKAAYEKTHPNVTLKLEGINASEGDYYTKIDLALRSASTAPDIVREDSFLIGSDATAGYLAPLDKYLAAWPEYKQQWQPAMQKITTFQGHNYGVMNGTDVRLIWYDKNVFKKAGLPTTWQPHNWADILTAARAIKAKVPGVIPLNCYSGIPQDEASTMQCFEMLLYGTKDPLYDYKTGKWIASSKGLLDTLTFVQTVYDSKNMLGPTNDISLSPHTADILHNQLMPTDKVGIDIDGSWVSSTWVPNGGRPWAQWQQVMGVAKMPTQFGQAPSYVTLSGGWSYAISSKSAHPDVAFDILKMANSQDMLAFYDTRSGNITPRKDVTTVSSYASTPLSSFYASLVAFTQFRPGFPAYPKISNQIDLAMENVMSGTSPKDAMSSFTAAVKGIAGGSNVEMR